MSVEEVVLPHPWRPASRLQLLIFSADSMESVSTVICDGPAGPGCWELFDLESDPDELRSLADDPAHADIKAELEKELAVLRTRYGA